MDNSVAAVRSGDSDLELTQLQKGKGEFCYVYDYYCDVYDERWGYILRGGVELSMMEQQQIFICISDAFFNPRMYGCLLPLVTTSF